MDTLLWLGLFSRMRNFVPAIIKENEQWLDVMFICDREKLIYSFFKTIRVNFPCNAVKKYSHCIHTNSFSPTKFPVNCCGIKCFCLPHFQLIDGSAWKKVCAT